MRWLLDTNVVSEGLRPRPNADVMEWIAGRAPEQVSISDVTIAELRYGAAVKLEAPRRQRVERFVTSVTELFQGRTLPITVAILVDWLQLARRLQARGQPQSAPDLMIASTARVHNLIVVSRNIRHFANTSVTVYDPWKDEAHRMDQP